VTLFQAVVLLWAGSEVLIGLTHQAPLKGRRQDRFSGPVLIVFLVGAVWLGMIVARRDPASDIVAGRSFVYGLGIAIAVAGIALRWYAVITLGRFFTTRVMTSPDQRVVATGPYRFVRHPSYTGMLLTVLGILLCSGNWLALACFVIALPGFAYRIRVEERALTNALGDPYRDYMRRTKRLVPFVV
jgi:protein-S-isoprenylcysteine O-methyltransferase Ste14